MPARTYGDDRHDLLDIRDPDEPVVRMWGDRQLYPRTGRPILEWLDSMTPVIARTEED